MSKFVRQLLFFFIFDALVILLFLFAETFLGLYVMMCFSILFVLYSNWIDFSLVLRFKKVFFFWLVFLLSLFVSSFFTHVIPLTISSLIFYLFIFLSFSFFLLVKKKNLSRDILFWHLLLVMLVVNLISFVFFFIPDFSNLIPGMNLVFSSYGHNHLGALLIMFIPVVWFYMVDFFKKRNKQKFISFVLLLCFFLINLVMSFGRVVILIGFLELIILGRLSYKNFISKKIIFKLGYFFVVLMFVLTIVAQILLVMFLSYKEGFSCHFPVINGYQDKVCKDFKKESRLNYWQTSLVSLKENFWVGYGPGTYSLVSRKYKTQPEVNTSYAHNAYLQVFAEGGILVFLSFLSLMIFSLYRVLKIAFNLNVRNIFSFKYDLSLNKAIFISLLAIYLDVLVDFDWSFLGILMITWILISVVLKSGKKANSNFKNTSMVMVFGKIKQRYLVSLIKFLFIIFSFFLFLVGIIGLGNEALIYFGKSKFVINYFPYIQTQMKLLVDDEFLDDESSEKLREVYKNHPLFYLQKDSDKSIESFKKYRNKILEIDPWYFYSSSLLIELYEKDPSLAEENLVNLSHLYKKAKLEGSTGYYVINKELAILSNRIADKYLIEKDLEKANYFYLIALDFNKWVWGDTFPAFLYVDFSDLEKEQFWLMMSDIEIQFFSKHRGDVARLHFDFVEKAFNEKDSEGFFNSLNRVIEINDAIILEFEGVLQDYADHMIIRGDDPEVIKLLTLMNDPLIFSYWAKSQLANFYLLQGENKLAEQEFEKCNQDWIEHSGEEMHVECHHSYELIKSGVPNKDKYYQVGKIIRQ
jgi:O-antigen ligase